MGNRVVIVFNVNESWNQKGYDDRAEPSQNGNIGTDLIVKDTNQARKDQSWNGDEVISI